MQTHSVMAALEAAIQESAYFPGESGWPGQARHDEKESRTTQLGICARDLMPVKTAGAFATLLRRADPI
jgi:hypothetical protein